MIRNFTLVHLAVATLSLSLTACASLPGTGGNAQRTAHMDTLSGDFLTGLFAASQKDYDAASDAFNRAALEQQSTQTTGHAFRFALASGDMEAARRHALAIIDATQDVQGNDFESFAQADLPRLTLAVLSIDEGQEEAARDYLDNRFETPLGKSVSSLLEAWLLYEKEGIEAAVIRMGKGGEGVYQGFNPYHLALMLDIDEQPAAAEPAFGKSLKGGAADFAVVAYAYFLESHRQPETALKFYETLSAEQGYLRRVGRMGLARLGEPLEGESDEFIRMAKKSPTHLITDARGGAAMALTNFAWAAYDQGISQQQAAERAGFKSLVVSLDIPLALAQLASVLDEDIGAADYIIGAVAGVYGNDEMAAQASKRVPPHSWLYNYAVIDQARALESLKKEDEAARLLRRYLKQDALAPDVALSLAELSAAMDRIDDAILYAGQAIDIANLTASDDTRDKNLWRYYFARGAIYADHDYWEEAKADLERALGLSPDEPLVLNYLGYSFIERGEKIDEAFAMIERALKEMPNSGAITDSLGWAYYQRGDYDAAIEHLERAVTLVPGDDTVTDHLGDAYWQAGRRIEARYEWRRVLTLNEIDPDVKRSVERKLGGTPPAPGALTTTSQE